MFLKKHLCENKSKRSSVRFLSLFSKVFVRATTGRVMERKWYLHSIYPILNVGRYLPKSWNLSKLKMLNWKAYSRHLMLKTYLRWSHKIPNPKLIFKNCRIKAYFDAIVYNHLNFEAISPFFNVCTVWFTRSHNALAIKISSDCTS